MDAASVAFGFVFGLGVGIVLSALARRRRPPRGVLAEADQRAVDRAARESRPRGRAGGK